jgi:hypothetical protein
MDDLTIPLPNRPTIVHVSFCDVAGERQLTSCMADVVRCGGTIQKVQVDQEAEIAYATVTVADHVVFHHALVATESGRYLRIFRAALPKA